jgi:hypothetical protein
MEVEGVQDVRDILSQFDVLYDANYAGTFNGCLESIHQSLETYIKDLVKREDPTIVLDHRTGLSRLLRYLNGNREKFHLTNGQYEWKKIPSVWTPSGYDLLYDLVESRNGHVHVKSSYDCFYKFHNITIPVGATYYIIFNPRRELKHSMIIDVDNIADVSNYHMTLRSDVPASYDLQPCEQYTADLILECLTKKEFQEENPDEPDFDKNTHALIIYYGRSKYFVYFTRTTYKAQ